MKKWDKEKIKDLTKRILQFILNPRLLLCFGIAWFITNGWCYLFIVLGSAFDIGWMSVAGWAWFTFLWLPISPEKIVTVFLAILFLRLFFPNDQKTLAVLKREQLALRMALRKVKQNRRRKRVIKWLIKELPNRRRCKKRLQT